MQKLAVFELGVNDIKLSNTPNLEEESKNYTNNNKEQIKREFNNILFN